LSRQEATTSAVIGFAEKLEGDFSDFYTVLARKYIENKEQFLSFAEDSKKNKIFIIRTYRETISDALEACFCFEGLNLEDFAITKTIGKDVSRSAALRLAIGNEERAIQFYTTVANLSTGLLATITMAFKRIAEKRKNRELTMRTLVIRA